MAKVVDEEMRKFLDGVQAVVDIGDSYSHHMLWHEYHYTRSHFTWEENNIGLMEIVGQLADMPVCISLSKARVDGILVLFVEPTSMVVDHRLIDKWYKETLPPTAFRKDGYPNKTDAMNFCNCIFDAKRRLETIDA